MAKKGGQGLKSAINKRSGGKKQKKKQQVPDNTLDQLDLVAQEAEKKAAMAPNKPDKSVRGKVQQKGASDHSKPKSQSKPKVADRHSVFFPITLCRPHCTL